MSHVFDRKSFYYTDRFARYPSNFFSSITLRRIENSFLSSCFAGKVETEHYPYANAGTSIFHDIGQQEVGLNRKCARITNSYPSADYYANTKNGKNKKNSLQVRMHDEFVSKKIS